MRKIIIFIVAAALTGCGIYKPYKRPEINTDGLYGTAQTADTATMGNIDWKQVFTDPHLQSLIEHALDTNTDLQSAHWRVVEAEATLKAARLSYLPSFNFAPQGSISRFGNNSPALVTSKVYNVPVQASWEIDIFNRLTNAKRRSKAVYAQSKEYQQAVRTQLIASVANLYYTLLMLDGQHALTAETSVKWKQSVATMRSLLEAGMVNQASVAQYEASSLSIEASLHDLQYQIRQVENSLCNVLAEVPHTIVRGKLEGQQIPQELVVGVPVQLLTNRPDVRAAEYGLMQAYYATSEARSGLYPKLTLSGAAGWTNSGGLGITNPGQLLLSAAGSLLQPIFNAGANRARVKIAKAQQEEMKLAFRQTLLNAGAEVNNALTQCQTSRAKTSLRKGQIEALERAVTKTEWLKEFGPTTSLEILVAQQSLLTAQLTQIADQFEEVQGVINLYQALGGGRQTAEAKK